MTLQHFLFTKLKNLCIFQVRVRFLKNTTALFFIDVQKAQYIRKLGAIWKQHYNTFFVSMYKRRNTSTSRVLFCGNTTTLFLIDVQKAQYIRKSGAILKQHYNTFLYRCANGATKTIEKQ